MTQIQRREYNYKWYAQDPKRVAHKRKSDRNNVLSKGGAYISWRSIRIRCYYPLHQGYKNYGARGITVCARWMGKDGFKNFYKDMGQRPKGTTIDRLDVNGNYEPSNCRWATPKQQLENRRITR